MLVIVYELGQKWKERKGEVDALNFSLNLVYLAARGRLKDVQCLKIIATHPPCRRHAPSYRAVCWGNALHLQRRQRCIFKEVKKRKKASRLTIDDEWRNALRKTELQIKPQKPPQ